MADIAGVLAIKNGIPIRRDQNFLPKLNSNILSFRRQAKLGPLKIRQFFFKKKATFK